MSENDWFYAAPFAICASVRDEQKTYYAATAARDARFDGVFFVGVASTGVYCRPVCPAKTPKLENCAFFETAARAEAAGFRPCLRCRPELAPGLAPMDDAARIAKLLVQRVEDSAGAQEKASIEALAAQFEISSRQLRRIVKRELGVSPLQLVQTRRLLLAKQLLGETALPITQVAFASGFSSLRRFNAAFLAHYGLSPSRLRAHGRRQGDAQNLVLSLGYRPPYDWDGILAFLRTRALAGAEHVSENAYSRTVELGGHAGWIEVRNAHGENALKLAFSPALLPVLPALISRVRALFDTDARPDAINARLGADARLKARVKAHAGLRVPGAFDGFELALRAILGQQVTVKAATTLSGRLTARFGAPAETPYAGLTHLSPRAERLARVKVDDIAALGIVRARAACIIALAQAVAQGALVLDAGGDLEKTMARLLSIQGIGAWTANYIAMRALRWPDAFPKEDIAMRKALGGVSAKEAEALSQPWRPWRSYAVLHLWGG